MVVRESPALYCAIKFIMYYTGAMLYLLGQ